ncbi:MAG: HK97 family phage prohead protease [Succinatimonas sp.]|nr:HK97 family phage prohead protease [Succinatimonas sp.]
MKPELYNKKISRKFNFNFSENLQDDGSFAGYASVFGAVDSYGTGWTKGCFKDSLAKYTDNNRSIPMLWSHDWQEPIGLYTKAYEDEHGLFVEGKIITEVPKGRQIYTLMKAGVVTGLSVCVSIDDYEYYEEQDLVTFTKVSLYEISPCVAPSVDEARIEEVRAFDIRNTEHALRLCGLTKSQAMKYSSLISKEIHSQNNNSEDIDFIKALTNKLETV